MGCDMIEGVRTPTLGFVGVVASENMMIEGVLLLKS
jgi:hypothetical protein